MPTETIADINIDQLTHDPSNPRLPKKLHGKSESDVINFMLKTANILELMASIGEQGFFSGEPLLAVKNQTTGKYEIIEGNRRLSAVKLLLNPEIATVRKSSVRELSHKFFSNTKTSLPVIIYPSKDKIIEYLGYRHITGVKAWDSLAKARYMDSLMEYTLSDNTPDKYKEIARIIGSKPNYVARILSGLKIYNLVEQLDFFDLDGIDKDNFQFSLFTTALSYKEIARFINLEDLNDEVDIKDIDYNNLKHLIAWIYQSKEGSTRLGESRNLSKLAKIVSSPRALEEFRDNHKTISDAIIYTDEPRQVFEASLLNSLTALQDANKNWYVISDKPEQIFVDNLEDIRKLSQSLRNSIRAALDEADES